MSSSEKASFMPCGPPRYAESLVREMSLGGIGNLFRVDLQHLTQLVPELNPGAM